MPRLLGVEIPADKRIEASLTYIYGIGFSTSRRILEQTNINPNLRAKDLIASSFFSARFGENLSQAARFLDQAVARDSHFLLAYCDLAAVHDYLYFYGVEHTPARLALATAAVENALRLGPNRGEAHLAKA